MSRQTLAERLKSYFTGGGLFNPEMALHDQVRDLLMDCRAELVSQAAEQERLHEAESTLASTTDLLNSWARESGVLEAGRPAEVHKLADRLWARLSSQLNDQRREQERLRETLRDAERLLDRYRTKASKLVERLGGVYDGGEPIQFLIADYNTLKDALAAPPPAPQEPK